MPKQDRSGYDNAAPFGSAHPGGCNMVFCDGSVRTISYGVSETVHQHLGNRKDGEVIDAGKL